MQGTLNFPWSTSTLVKMLPVAKKQPLPTTSVSGRVTWQGQRKGAGQAFFCGAAAVYMLAACKPIAHPCPKVAPHIRMKAGTMEASASISDACSTMDIFKAAICALMLSKEEVKGGFTLGRTRQRTAVPPSWST